MITADQADRMLRRLAAEKAVLFRNEVFVPQTCRLLRLPKPDTSLLRDALADPYASLQMVYGYYAFSRRGNERAEYSQFGMEALARAVGSPSNIERFLDREKPESLWAAFVEVCSESQRKSNEQLNRAMLEGFMSLAQDIYREDGVGSIVSWVQEGIVQTQKVEPQFLRIVQIRGIGPKLASLILRDAVWLTNMENQVDWSDRLFLQPVDAWVRRTAEYISTEPLGEGAADWVIAGKLAKLARRANVSGIALSHGIQYFGNYEVRNPQELAQRVRELSRPYETPNAASGRKPRSIATGRKSSASRRG